MFAFLALLFVLIVIYFFTSTRKDSEGFDPVNTSPSHEVNIPVNIIPPTIPPPPARSIDDSHVKPADLPGPLPIAPYEQIASTSPLPYQDTTLIKANRQQLVSMLELVKGFLSFEAQEISERSDPTIQLPLNTARGDFHTLQAEVDVLNRNPGLQPTITLSHLNEIASNLAYLQREVRLIGAAGPIQGPIYEFTNPVDITSGGALEGFVDITGKSSTIAPNISQAPVTSKSTSNSIVAPNISQAPVTSKSTLNSIVAPNISQAPVTSKSTSNGSIATMEDLQGFFSRISGEIIRLSASGTTDPVIKARVVALTQMKNNIQNIITQVDNGVLLRTEIPVMKKDIENAFPILGNPNEPLPQIIKTLGLPAGLSNILPPNIQKDPAVTRDISNLIDKYAGDVINGMGLTASLEVRYTPSRESDIAKNFASAMQAEKDVIANSQVDKTGFPSLSDLQNISNQKFMPQPAGLGMQSTLGVDAGVVNDRMAAKPVDAGRGPSHFEWKARTKDIESQVKKRGLKQSDFGIMPEGTKVSDDFSWKGYARMICNRLQATMDPALPETCGCPPMDWAGWRIAK